MPIQHWSTTAADNDDADSTINWAEGQVPSGVNNSARAMMKVIADWRDLMGGAIASTGSSNAYVLSSGITLTAYRNGFQFAFEANHTNTGAATLNVDSLGAKNLKTVAGVALAAGQIVSGGIYQCVYESGADFVQVLNPTVTATTLGLVIGTDVAPVPASSSLPIGFCSIMEYTSSTALTNGSTTSGSNVRTGVIEQNGFNSAFKFGFSVGAQQSGTWTNISGETLDSNGSNAGGLMVRTA